MYEDTRQFRRPKHQPSKALHLTAEQINVMTTNELLAFTGQDLRMIAGRVGTFVNGGTTKAKMVERIMEKREEMR